MANGLPETADGVLPELAAYQEGLSRLAETTQGLIEALVRHIGHVAVVEGVPTSRIFVTGADPRNQGRAYVPISGEESICVPDGVIARVYKVYGKGTTEEDMVDVEFPDDVQQYYIARGKFYVGYRFPLWALRRVTSAMPAEESA